MRGTMLALLAAAIFQLWDGRSLEVKEWLRHGDEYVVTLTDGRVLILRQQEVREIAPQGSEGSERGQARPLSPPSGRREGEGNR